MNRRALLLRSTVALAILLFALPANAFFGGGGGGMKEGDVAPAFSAQTIEGQPLNYAQLKGKKVVVLDFWSIYCASCVEEIPRLVEIYNEFKDKGLLMVGVNLDSFGTQRVVKFMNGMPTKINFPVIIDKDRKVATSFNAMVLPTTLVIGADGKIKFYHVGYKAGDEKHIRTVIADAVKQIKK
ncbi:MAG TPA: TlpA disulfide reductase family protein [Candidatus Deferrimicrobiaceae bacterium]